MDDYSNIKMALSYHIEDIESFERFLTKAFEMESENEILTKRVKELETLVQNLSNILKKP